MTYCHGTQSPYGCGHHDEHVRAARLGWRRHKAVSAYEGSEEQRLVSTFLEERIRGAHTHESHPRTIAFQDSRGRWFELSRREWNSFIAGGRQVEREQARARKAAEQSARKEERAARLEAGYRRAQERAHIKLQLEEHGSVVKRLREMGGVRPSVTRQGTKHERSEYLTLPSQVRRARGRLSLDDAQARISDEFPWLNLETPDDLVNYFDRARTYRRKLAEQRTRERRSA